MGALIDLTGQKFGQLTVIGRFGEARDRAALWLVQCECGSAPKPVRGAALRYGRVRTCGCSWTKPKRAPRTPAEEAERRRVKNAKHREWRAANVERLRAYALAWRDRNRGKVRDYYLAQYGLTRASFDALFASQGHACAICRSTDPGAATKDWHVDHCHATKRVRGVLCHGCNVGIGHFKDDADRVEAAARYLRATPAR